MDTITSLEQMVQYLCDSGINKRIAVAVAEDENTIGALIEAQEKGFATPILIGNKSKIEEALIGENAKPESSRPCIGSERSSAYGS